MRILYTVVIPTFNRQSMLDRALKSALEQTCMPLDVVVVDDGSEPPARVPNVSSVRLIRLPQNRGNAAARNAGLWAARGHYVTFLDDDDVLLPDMAARSLATLAASRQSPPVACLSAVAVIGQNGDVLETRVPPSLPRGSHFNLEDVDPSVSFQSKQTLFVEAEVLRAIGGFDESFRSRVPSELFLRLNPSCSIEGTPHITYWQYRHGGNRVSTQSILRRKSFEQFMRKHAAVMAAHPKGCARLLLQHARTLWAAGDHFEAVTTFVRAMRTHPRTAFSALSRRLTK